MVPIDQSVPNLNRPDVNYTIIFFCGISFIYELSFAIDPELMEAFIYKYAVVPSRYTSGTDPYFRTETPGMYLILPLFTNMFLHGGWGHLLGNMWSLYIFGNTVEDSMGSRRYLIFYILCGFIASLTHIFFNWGSEVPSLGASGAIAGVMGAYLFLFPRAKVKFFVPIPFIWVISLSAFVYLGWWFLLQLFGADAGRTGTADPTDNVAYWAHIGGFVAGAVLYRWFINPERLEAKKLYMNKRMRRIYNYV